MGLARWNLREGATMTEGILVTTALVFFFAQVVIMARLEYWRLVEWLIGEALDDDQWDD